METSKWQWLAEVRVPIDDKFRLSTGVPLSRRYILTAGHGVPSDLGAKVEIRFIADFKAGRNWRSGKVVWHGKEKLDASLLEIDPFDEIESFIYSGALPHSTTPWEGAGFPAATKITEGELKGYRESKGLAGMYLPGGGLKREELDLNVQSPPSISGEWMGISGAPVLCGGKLIGIVKSFKQDFDGGNLSGVSIRELLKLDSFRQRLGVRDREDLLDSALADVGRLLESNENLAKAFGLQLNVEHPKYPVAEILTLLKKTEIQVFEEIVFDVYKAIKDSYKGSLSDLQQVFNIMLPMLYDEGVVNSVHSQLITGAFLQLPVATKTIAEIVMAAVGKRPASYREPIGGSSWPVGYTLIEAPPESGFSNPKEDMVAAFDQFLMGKYVTAEDRSKSITTVRGIINLELRMNAKRLGGEDSHRHYFILETKSVEKQMEQIDTLRSVYPQITFAVLREEEDTVLEESEQAWALKAIREARREEAKK